MNEEIQSTDADEIFSVVETIRDDGHGRIERVVRTSDNARWIRRSYRDDRRAVFRALAKIETPHLPKIERILFSDETVVIEEEISGTPLSEHILAGTLASDDATRIARQLLKVLCRLQEHSVVHRDLKPGNILIRPNGDVCLIDFGIARILRPGALRDTSLFGTAGYAAPEQFGFAQTDARADIYALGVLIREMCGERTGLAWRALRSFADHCAAFDPDKRYKDAAEALRGITKIRRRPFIFAAAIALLLSLAGLGACIAIADPFRKEPSVQEQRGEYLKIVRSEYQNLSAILANGEVWRTRGRLAQDERPVEVEAALSDDLLTVTLQDTRHPKKIFSFRNDAPPKVKSYEKTSVFAELLFVDLDDDGRSEILVSLSARMEMRPAVWGQNWSKTWCVGHAPNDGFWLANETVETTHSNAALRIGVFALTGQTILERSDPFTPPAFYMLHGRELREYSM